MAEFTPEYEALMRQLAIEHEFQKGDWCRGRGPAFLHEGPEHAQFAGIPAHANGRWAWLPLEGDWLRMLEEAGARYIRLFDASRVAADRWPGWRAKAVIHDGPETQEITGAGTNFLEALARLWMAVTGRDA